MEKKITFQSSQLQLEGLLDLKSADNAVVVLHPHPLYGGEMGNPVVETLVTTYGRKGWSTLRFNFRGVGGSEGHYDHGNGEQRDVLAAISLLTAQGIKNIHLAGYSFGSWVQAALTELPQEVSAQIMVSPPVALLPLPDDLPFPKLKLIVTGEYDEIAPANQLEKVVKNWNPNAAFHVVDGADHFYYGCFRDLENLISGFLKD